MLKLIQEILRVGEATVAYPFEPMDVMPGFRGKPIHNSERCIACAACMIACPPNALTIETDLDQGARTWSLFVGRCIYCGRCEEVCPTRAITLGQDFELAVADKRDLVEQADYILAACQCCGRYFAPIKEIEYARALIEKSDLPADYAAKTRALLEVCSECKRQHDVRKLVELYQETD